MNDLRRVVVVDDDLPDYELGRDIRMDGLTFIKWQPQRWLGSDLALRGDYEVKGMARDLFDISYAQSPIGTLPRDPETLSILLRVDLRKFNELCSRKFGPLHNWVPCRCGHEIRLMHPVVLENLKDVIERRELKKVSSDAKAVAMRKKRLREGLEALGLCAEALADETLINRIDNWLLQDQRYARRGAEAYGAALHHAVQNKWVNSVGSRSRVTVG